MVRSTGTWYDVVLENGSRIKGRAKGKLRLLDVKATNPVAVGDWVEISLEENDPSSGVIVEVLDRKNYLVRESPRKKYSRHILAANLDQAMLVTTIKQPNLKIGFIDRFLISCEAYHVPPVLIFNKVDLLQKEKDKNLLEETVQLYESIGYKAIKSSAETMEGTEEVKELLKDKVTLIAGHSGVGKSTLVNAIAPGLDLKTAAISGYTGKGTHTTTFATMYELPFDGWIIDSPGIKELSLLDLEPEEVSHYLPEMRQRLQECQFNNCMHMNEPGCAIKAAVDSGEVPISRYYNYLGIVDDIQQRDHWEYKDT